MSIAKSSTYKTTSSPLSSLFGGGGNSSSSSKAQSQAQNKNQNNRDGLDQSTVGTLNVTAPVKTSIASQYGAYRSPPSYTYSPETGGSYTVGDRNNPNAISNPNTFRNALSPNGQALFEGQRQAALLSGAQVRPFSGLAGRNGTVNHPRGNAIDVSVMGPNGSYLPNYQNPASFRAYEQFAQDTKKQLDNTGYTGPVRWGGYFSYSDGHPADLMHMDVTPGAGTAGGSWKTGATAQQLAHMPGAKSLGIGTGQITKKQTQVASSGIPPNLIEDVLAAKDTVHLADVPPIPAPVDVSGLSAPAKAAVPALRNAASSYPAIAAYNASPRGAAGSYAALKAYDSPITQAAYGDYQQPPGSNVAQMAESYGKYRQAPSVGAGMTTGQMADAYSGFQQQPSQALKIASSDRAKYRQPPGSNARQMADARKSYRQPPGQSRATQMAENYSGYQQPPGTPQQKNKSFVQGGLGAMAYGKSDRKASQVASSAANESLTGAGKTQVADRGLLGLKGKIADNRKPIPGLTTAGRVASYLPIAGPFMKATNALDNFAREANKPKSIYEAAFYDPTKPGPFMSGESHGRSTQDELAKRLALASLFGDSTSNSSPISVNYVA